MNNVRDRAGRSICNWMHLFIYYLCTFGYIQPYSWRGCFESAEIVVRFHRSHFFLFFHLWTPIVPLHVQTPLFHLTQRTPNSKKKKILTFFAFVSPPRLSLCVLSVEHRYGGIVYISLGPYRSTFLFISFSACNIWYTESGFYSQCVQFLSPSWAYPPIHSISFSLSMQHSRLTHTQTFLTNSKFCFDI